METLFEVLAAAGALLWLAGQIAIVIAAYGEGLLWMWGCLLVPGVSLLFALLHWHEAKTGMALYGFGLAILVPALVLGPLRSETAAAALRAQAETQTGARPAGAQPGARPAGEEAEACDGAQQLPSGYAKWCCSRRGWRLVNGTGCAADPPAPVGRCDDGSRGTPSLIRCVAR